MQQRLTHMGTTRGWSAPRGLGQIAPQGKPCLRKRHFFGSFPYVCPACLGKMIIFSIKWRKKWRFPTGLIHQLCVAVHVVVKAAVVHLPRGSQARPGQAQLCQAHRLADADSQAASQARMHAAAFRSFYIDMTCTLMPLKSFTTSCSTSPTYERFTQLLFEWPI